MPLGVNDDYRFVCRLIRKKNEESLCQRLCLTSFVQAERFLKNKDRASQKWENRKTSRAVKRKHGPRTRARERATNASPLLIEYKNNRVYSFIAHFRTRPPFQTRQESDGARDFREGLPKSSISETRRGTNSSALHHTHTHTHARAHTRTHTHTVYLSRQHH